MTDSCFDETTSACPFNVWRQHDVVPTAMQDAGMQQVHSGQLPETMCVEGLLMQFVIDARLDEMLESMYKAVTRPPLPQQPLACAAEIAQAFAFRMETQNSSIDSVMHSMCNSVSSLITGGVMPSLCLAEKAADMGSSLRRCQIL
jgi:hypothetical protein